VETFAAESKRAGSKSRILHAGHPDKEEADMSCKALRVAFALCAALAAGAVFAQSWPQKPIHIWIGFAAGGTPDIGTRIIAPKLTEALGQPVVVDNRPGAGGILAMEYVSKAPPDGYTLALGTVGTLVLAKALIPTAAYDPITSFTPIGAFAKITFMVAIRTNLPATNLKEFIALAKSRPGKLNYGSSTPGSPPHILCEMFKQQAGIDVVGITYKGSAEAVTRFLAGDVQMLADAYPSLGPLIAAGKARALLVTSSTRFKKLPDVPTAAEAGLPDYTVESWLGVVGPAGTPDAAVRRMNAELVKVMAPREMAAAMDKIGLEIFTTTPEEFAALIKRDWPKWSSAVRSAGIKPQ
jgi:tripartite-type tricarboxylate transporter receptor subunit TctC